MFIIATISKNSYAPEKIEEIILAGASMLRFNFSHGSFEQMVEHIEVAREVIEHCGLAGSVKIIADLPGGKLRLGSFEPISYRVEAGQSLLFKSGSISDDPELFVPVDVAELGKLVALGQEISIDDGNPAFRVTEIVDDSAIRATALTSGEILNKKGFIIGQGIDQLEHLTALTLSHIQKLSMIKPDYVALSFVNSTAYIERAAAYLKAAYGGQPLPAVIAKIESPEGVQRIKEIAQTVDLLMVARGDLALNVPYETLGLSQKKIISAAKAAGKPVVVATQILESLLVNNMPSRSEILDLTNIILDGADGIMLAKETGLSLTPGRSVAIAKRIIEAVSDDKFNF